MDSATVAALANPMRLNCEVVDGAAASGMHASATARIVVVLDKAKAPAYGGLEISG